MRSSARATRSRRPAAEARRALEADRERAGRGCEIDALQAASARTRRPDPRRAGGARQPAPRRRRRRRRAGLIWPVNGPVTSPFGWRWGRMHRASTSASPYGTPIHAAAAGTVIYCGWEEGYGTSSCSTTAATSRPPTATSRRSPSLRPAGEPGRRHRLRRAAPATAPARTSTSRCGSTATRSTRSAICSAASFYVRPNVCASRKKFRRDDHGGHDRRRDRRHPAVDELAHQIAPGREEHERDQRERDPEGEHDLAR